MLDINELPYKHSTWPHLCCKQQCSTIFSLFSLNYEIAAEYEPLACVTVIPFFLGTTAQLFTNFLLVFTGLLPKFSSCESMPEYLEAKLFDRYY